MKTLLHKFFFEDPWEMIDNIFPRINLLRNYRYTRKVALIVSTLMIPVWFFLGFDSGMGMIEEWIRGGDPYSVYGVTFHFSTLVIYGYTFCGLSFIFERLGIVRSKNMVYSGCLVLFQISIWENWWMSTFAYFHEGLGFFQWFTLWFRNDAVTFTCYFLLLFLGAYTIFCIYVDSYTLNFTWKFTKKLLITGILLVSGVMFWVYYPFPVEIVQSKFFPQTHYWGQYIQNDGVHMTNVLVKALFALFQVSIINCLQRRKQ